MIRRPPRSTQSRSSAASDVYKRQVLGDAVEPAGRIDEEDLLSNIHPADYAPISSLTSPGGGGSIPAEERRMSTARAMRVFVGAALLAALALVVGQRIQASA